MNKTIKIAIILGTLEDKPRIQNQIDEIRLLHYRGYLDFNISLIGFKSESFVNHYFQLTCSSSNSLVDILENYDITLFITTVHSYHISDLITDYIDKMTNVYQLELKNNRLPRNKYVAIISFSDDEFIGEDIFQPVETFAKDLDMDFLGKLEICYKKNNKGKIKEFMRTIVQHVSRRNP